MKRLSIVLMLCAMMAMKSMAQVSKKLIPFVDLGKSMAIGLSVNSENRIFLSFPNYDGNGALALAEYKNGQLSAYPDKIWNEKHDYNKSFLRVQDLFVDANDNLWVLDSKPSPAQNIFGDTQSPADGQFKLVKINTTTNQVVKVYLFEDLDKKTSALNDVRIDVKADLAYLSDPGQAAVVVLNLKTGRTRSVLKNTSFTLAGDRILNYDGVPMQDKSGKPFVSNVNGIALTADFKYFYFKPINNPHLYRVETKFLADSSLSENALAQKVEDMGIVGVTHGLIADKKGNVYLSTSESHSISYLTPDGKLKTLVKDVRFHWPDSFGIGSDGFLYFSDSQLQRLPQWNNGVDKTDYPYRAYKIKLP